MATGVISLIITTIGLADKVRKRVKTVKGFRKETEKLEENISSITSVLNSLKEVLQANSSADGEPCRRTVAELQSCMIDIEEFLLKLDEKSDFRKLATAGSIEDKFERFDNKLLNKLHIFQSELLVKVHSDVAAVLRNIHVQGEGRGDAGDGNLSSNDKSSSEKNKDIPSRGPVSMNPASENSGDGSIPMDQTEPEAASALQSTFDLADSQTSCNEIDGSMRVPADRILINVSDAITKDEDVEALGGALQVPQEEIQKAKEANSDGLDSKGTLNMLQNWQGTRPMREVCAILKKALKQTSLLNKVRGGTFPDTKPKSNRGKKNGAYGGGEFYDVFLLSDGIDADEDVIMKIAEENKWRVITRNNFRLGEGVMHTIARVLESSSYIIVLVTDTILEDGERECTIEMSFQAGFTDPYKKIIPIRCCERDKVPIELKSKIGIAIDSPKLKEQLEEVISTSHREERERQYFEM